MKKSFVLACLVMFCGCSYGQNYLKNPESFIRDPHFAEYKKNRDALESSYLKKELTYAEYIKQKDRVDDKYSKEVQERTAVIMSSD